MDLSKHPCFNKKVKGQFGRVHLPVAPKCNIKCNYCNRKYDCVNESRPGVTSSVLSPAQSLEYMRRVLEKEPRISVAGIAGPGDPFANGDETMETMRLLRQEYPSLLLCLASNGMAIGPYIEELAAIQVSHVTITVNAVDPKIAGQIYAWVHDGKVAYQGVQAGELILSRQLEAVRKLKEYGVTVKINCIAIPGVNDHHIVEVASKMKELGADLFNCMALFPNVDTVFGSIEQPSKQVMEQLRRQAEQYLPQMRHCTRCRADAVGLLDDDRTEEFRGCLSACSTLPQVKQPKRSYVAVATMEGVLVNQHLGEAQKFQIWARKGDGFAMIEERNAPQTGGGLRRWLRLAKSLADCQAVLCSGIGEKPHEILTQSGVKPLTMNGFIEEGLKNVFDGKDLAALQARKNTCAGKVGCAGGGAGCM
jgi:nitrogen fixation protein NifB